MTKAVTAKDRAYETHSEIKTRAVARCSPSAYDHTNRRDHTCSPRPGRSSRDSRPFPSSDRDSLRLDATPVATLERDRLAELAWREHSSLKRLSLLPPPLTNHTRRPRFCPDRVIRHARRDQNHTRNDSNRRRFDQDQSRDSLDHVRFSQKPKFDRHDQNRPSFRYQTDRADPRPETFTRT